MVFICSDMKWNKGSILKATVDYVRSLQSEQSRYRQIDKRNKEMETLNKKLLLRVQVPLFKSAAISLSRPNKDVCLW